VVFAIQVQSCLVICVSRYKFANWQVISQGVAMMYKSSSASGFIPCVINSLKSRMLFCKNHDELMNYTIRVIGCFYFLFDP